MNLKYFFVPMGITMAIGLVIIALGAGYLAYPFANPAPAPEVVQLPAQIIEVPVEQDVPVAEIVAQILAAMPTPAPVIAIDPRLAVLSGPTPTPVPVMEWQAPECIDLANLIIETPYFKTWASSVQAGVTVQNAGTCIWDEYYLAPYQVMIPYTMPGGFQALAFEIPTGKGLQQIVLEARNQKGEVVPSGAPPADVQFDYANPQTTVPQNMIIINVPTQDWEGIVIDWPKYYRIGGWDYWCWGGT